MGKSGCTPNPSMSMISHEIIWWDTSMVQVKQLIQVMQVMQVRLTHLWPNFSVIFLHLFFAFFIFCQEVTSQFWKRWSAASVTKFWLWLHLKQLMTMMMMMTKGAVLKMMICGKCVEKRCRPTKGTWPDFWDRGKVVKIPITRMITYIDDDMDHDDNHDLYKRRKLVCQKKSFN